MKQLSIPIYEEFRVMGRETIYKTKIGKELLQKWECEYCKTKFNENIKICEKCGR